ncbi:MAG: universal stress protein [Gammaproteobacteria bacterium]|nr:MAG: universal stress protein [Gammaproteobacteria bacterium]RKZ96334.1 MAG: universal stress protein [Gammaproteobacteria bacterium]RKZ96472.1 MAG: universal stress protein [Gammaproteobacteria bacterium]RLA01207.1 MAG: universal stress protein [Gammaproteobacteria bacterium]
MANYQHILIAADFSDHGQQVTARAQELAQRYQAKLSICHIIEDYPITDFAYEPMISVDIDMRDALLESGKKQILAMSNKLTIPVENQWVEFGSPNHDIVRLAQENNADLIVIGSHGRHGIKLLLGSTANAVLHHAQCDVLAVRLSDK